jgi:hypothetical protein
MTVLYRAKGREENKGLKLDLTESGKYYSWIVN